MTCSFFVRRSISSISITKYCVSLQACEDSKNITEDWWAKPKQNYALRVNCMIFVLRIIGWLGLEGAFKITYFQPPTAMGCTPLVPLSMSLTKVLNSIRPSTDTQGTPLVTGFHLDAELLISNLLSLSIHQICSFLV